MRRIFGFLHIIFATISTPISESDSSTGPLRYLVAPHKQHSSNMSDLTFIKKLLICHFLTLVSRKHTS